AARRSTSRRASTTTRASWKRWPRSSLALREGGQQRLEAGLGARHGGRGARELEEHEALGGLHDRAEQPVARPLALRLHVRPAGPQVGAGETSERDGEAVDGARRPLGPRRALELPRPALEVRVHGAALALAEEEDCALAGLRTPGRRHLVRGDAQAAPRGVRPG